MSETASGSRVAPTQLRRVLAIAAVVLLANILAFGSTLGADYLADDFGLIARATTHLAAEEGPWRSFFQDQVASRADQLTRFWRPVYEASFLVDAALFGDEAFGSRLINLGLHTCVAVLVGVLALMLGVSFGTSAFAAVLFAVWPSHAEAVAWVTARCDLLAGSFSLFAIVAALRAARHRGTANAAWRLLSLLAFAAGLLTKEWALAVLPMLVLANGSLRRSGPEVTLAGCWFFVRWNLLGTAVGGYKWTPESLAAGSTQVRDFALAVVAPLRADLIAGAGLPRAVLFCVAGLVICCSVVAWRARPRLGFAATLWTVLATAIHALAPFDATNFEGARMLYAPAIGIALLVAIGSSHALAQGLARWDARRRLARAFTMACVGVAAMALLHIQAKPYVEASQVMRRLRSDITRLVDEHESGTIEIREVPHTQRGAQVAAAIENIDAAPFVPAHGRGRLRILSDRAGIATLLSDLEHALAPDAPVHRYVFTDAATLPLGLRQTTVPRDAAQPASTAEEIEVEATDSAWLLRFRGEAGLRWWLLGPGAEAAIDCGASGTLRVLPLRVVAHGSFDAEGRSRARLPRATDSSVEAYVQVALQVRGAEERVRCQLGAAAALRTPSSK